MLVTIINFDLIEDTNAVLHNAFKIKDMVTLKFFLDVESSRSSKSILMNYWKYALEIILDLGISFVNPAWIPLESNSRLSTSKLDNLMQTTDGDILEDKTQRLICKILYLTLTRPDIAFSVQTLSQLLQEPKQSNWETTIRVTKYMKREPAFRGPLSSENSSALIVYLIQIGPPIPMPGDQCQASLSSKKTYWFLGNQRSSVWSLVNRSRI